MAKHRQPVRRPAPARTQRAVAPTAAASAPTSETIRLTQEEAREYLGPPGDSSRLQPAIDASLQRMYDAAIDDGTIHAVVIEIIPDAKR